MEVDTFNSDLLQNIKSHIKVVKCSFLVDYVFYRGILNTETAEYRYCVISRLTQPQFNHGMVYNKRSSH